MVSAFNVMKPVKYAPVPPAWIAEEIGSRTPETTLSVTVLQMESATIRSHFSVPPAQISS